MSWWTEPVDPDAMEKMALQMARYHAWVAKQEPELREDCEPIVEEEAA